MNIHMPGMNIHIAGIEKVSDVGATTLDNTWATHSFH